MALIESGSKTITRICYVGYAAAVALGVIGVITIFAQQPVSSILPYWIAAVVVGALSAAVDLKLGYDAHDPDAPVRIAGTYSSDSSSDALSSFMSTSSFDSGSSCSSDGGSSSC